MNCNLCNTINPSQAKFCFNCGNKIEISSQNYSFDVPEKLKEIKSWGYRIVKALPMPYWISLILLWQFLLVGDFLISKHYGADSLLIFNLFLYGSYAGCCIVIEFCNREMQQFYPRLVTFVSEPQEKIESWYIKGIRAAYMGKGSLLCAMVFTIIGAISTFEIIQAKTGPYSAVVWYRVITSAIGFFFIGAGIWGIFSIIKITSQLSQFRINVKLFAVGNDSVMALGSLLLRMSLAISSVYFLYLASVVVGDIITSEVVLFWNGMAIMSILLFFIIPQYRIHKIMAREKQQRLNSFTVYLEKMMNDSLDDPSAEKFIHLKGLFELKEHLSGMHEWTFRTGAISQLISVLLIPLLLVLLEVYMSK